MAEKLSKESWVGFTKKHKLSLEDSALVKALEKFDRAGDAAALEGIAEQAKKQVAALVKLKKELGDRLFGEAKDKLYELLEEAEKQQKTLAASAKVDEEEDSPALLTTAMIPLVRQLHKGEVQMHALIALSSRKAAVLISRRAIAPARRKLLAEYLQESSGLKYIVAECAGSAGQLDFLLDTSPGGLSKKLRQAVLDQTGLRTRIFVQFGEEKESDGEAEAEEQAADPALATFQARLEALHPRLQQARQAQPALTVKFDALLGFANDKAEAGQYAAALKGLEALEKLLETGSAAPVTPPAQKPVTSFVAFTQTRLAWDQTRKTVRAELKKLESEILAVCKDEPDFAEIQAGTKTLYELLEVLDERLIDKLDEALNAASPQQRQQLHLEARAIVDEYIDFVHGDELIADIDANGFTPTAVRSTLTTRLNDMADQLAASHA